MKYMGSKRWMLLNGLGDLLTEKGGECERFIDLFAGSGAVAAFVARKYKVPCYAFDIQEFSAVLNGAILCRSAEIDGEEIWKNWKERASSNLDSAFKKRPTVSRRFSKAYVDRCRAWSNTRRGKIITSSYGGHYFSPEQALWIDALRSTLPVDKKERTVALAALIQAASQSAAAPGHTAQPFQPTSTALRFIEEAWGKSIPEKTELILSSIAKHHALCIGEASVMDANSAVNRLEKGDLVFIDPPYSGVHYSRFYHVLETIARGTCSKVSGVGRYPRPDERPRSDYSIGSKSLIALDKLLKVISEKRAKAILTFPSHACSNGLSGDLVTETCSKYFNVTKTAVDSKFSSMGGNNKSFSNGNPRSARKQAKELILYLAPKL